ncbi:MAG: hypothetical protein ACOY0T_20715 [Myxococcota bacterium]
MKKLVRAIEKALLLGSLLAPLACGQGGPEDAMGRDAKALDPCVDDALEPNQSAVQAVNLPFGSSVEAVSCPQNVDFYQFQGPPAGTPFTVSMLFVSDDFEYGTDTGDLNALLRDQAGNLLFIGDRVAKDNEFLPAVSDGGVYSLEVQSAQRRVPYTLAVTQGSLRCGILEDQFEPNNSSLEAKPIDDLGSVTNGYICRGDSDFYRIQGPAAGQTLIVSYAHDEARGSLNARVWDQDGELVGSGSSSETVAVPSDGRQYWVEVYGYGKQSTSYQLSFATQTPTCDIGHDSLEPNDRLEDATPLAFPSVTDATLCSGNADYYRFTGPGIGLPFDVDVQTTTAPVTVEIRNAASGEVEYARAYHYGGSIRLVSRGVDYVVRIGNPTYYALQSTPYRLTLSEPVGGARRCDLERDLGSLATACAVANAGPVHATNLAVDPPPQLQTGNSYIIKLLAELDPLTNLYNHRGQASFTATTSGTYALFSGSPGVPLTLRAGAETVSAQCSLSFSNRDCNKLLRGDRYELVAGVQYTLDIGPIVSGSADPRSVRLGIESTTPDDSTRACATFELRGLDATCQDASLGRTLVAAGSLESSGGPAIEQQTIYGVRLNETATGNSGALTFTPPVSGEYVVYTSIPKLPLAVRDEAAVLAPRCGGALNVETCTELRFAATYSFEGGRTYRFEFGPTSPQTYVRFSVQPNVTYVAECDVSELESLTRVCPSAAAPDTIVSAIAGFGSELTTLGYPPLSAANVRLAELDGSFGGSIGFVAYTSRMALFTGSAAVPMRMRSGSRTIQPLCMARIPSSTCDVLKVAYVYSPDTYRRLELDFGPSDRRWVRVAWGPEENAPPPEAP